MTLVAFVTLAIIASVCVHAKMFTVYQTFNTFIDICNAEIQYIPINVRGLVNFTSPLICVDVKKSQKQMAATLALVHLNQIKF